MKRLAGIPNFGLASETPGDLVDEASVKVDLCKSRIARRLAWKDPVLLLTACFHRNGFVSLKLIYLIVMLA
jgi:hypothetical protein